MKYGKLIFLFALIICFGLTIQQKDNLKNIWTEYWKLHTSFDERMYNASIPVIDKKIEKLDPEAAAIINFRLGSFSRDSKEGMEILSQNILQFPNNQFFLHELATYTYCNLENGLSPQILLKLSDRLIELDDKNSNYYYLKAYALLMERKGNDFNEVIEAIKKATECEYSKDPYVLYKERVLALAKKQGLHFRLMDNLYFEEPYSFFIRKLRDTLIQYENFLITEKAFDKAEQLSAVLKATSQNEPLSRMQFMFSGGFGNWGMPQQLELQRKDLTKDEADRRRMELCSYISLDTIVKSQHKSYEYSKEAGRYALAVFPFLYLSRLAFLFLVLCVILLSVMFIRKENPVASRISKASAVRYLIYGFVFLVSSQFLLIAELFTNELSCGCCHYNYSDIFLFTPVLKKLDFGAIRELWDAPFYVYLPFIAFIVVICMGIIKFFKPKLDNIGSRFAAGILLAIPLGLACGILQGHTYIKYLTALMFILFAFKYSFRIITIKNILQVFIGSRREGINTLRRDVLQLSGISFLICWLGFLLLAPMAYKSMGKKEIDVSEKIYSYSGDPEKGYQEIINKIHDVNLYEQSVPYYLSLVQSKDLSQALLKLKKKRYAPPWRIGFGNANDVNEKTSDYLYDCQIVYSLHFAGRDQMHVMISYLNDSENIMALIARARLGDKSVKNDLLDKLSEIKKLGNNIDELENAYGKRIPRDYELITALSVILEPNEAVALVKEYFDTHPAERLDMYFHHKGPNMLPKPYALKVLNLYLDKAEKEINDVPDFRKYDLLYPLRDTQGLYWDSQTAKRVLTLILSACSEEHIETFGIEHYLESDSSGILLKGLKSDKENLRAWCVLQLEKIGYEWDKEELENLSEDKSWKVRANFAVANPSLIKENENSDYVKLIKRL